MRYAVCRMKQKNTYGIILFSILMVLLFLPMLQAHVFHIPVKPLNGVTVETEQPDFSLESYRSGDYAKQEEAYMGEHFGFREPVIRLYNQYLWSCFRERYFFLQISQLCFCFSLCFTDSFSLLF